MFEDHEDLPLYVGGEDCPFFTLRVDVFEVLKDFGHFSRHENLPLSVDRKDCLWKYHKMLASEADNLWN